MIVRIAAASLFLLIALLLLLRVQPAGFRGMAFTVITVATGRSTTSPRTLHGRRTFSVSPDGSRANKEENLGTGEVSRWLESSDGILTVAFDHIRRKYTRTGQAAVFRDLRMDPAKDCVVTLSGHRAVGWRLDGADMVGGYRTVRVKRESGGWKETIWYALDLGCAALRCTGEHHHDSADGKVVTRFEERLVLVQFGEPSAALFFTGDLIEVPPAEIAVARENYRRGRQGLPPLSREEEGRRRDQ